MIELFVLTKICPSTKHSGFFETFGHGEESPWEQCGSLSLHRGQLMKGEGNLICVCPPKKSLLYLLRRPVRLSPLAAAKAVWGPLWRRRRKDGHPCSLRRAETSLWMSQLFPDPLAILTATLFTAERLPPFGLGCFCPSFSRSCSWRSKATSVWTWRLPLWGRSRCCPALNNFFNEISCNIWKRGIHYFTEGSSFSSFSLERDMA